MSEQAIDGGYSEHYVRKLESERDRLAAELETERMRLAACGVAALGYFDGCKDEYRSASLDDTLRLYEKAERLAAENERLENQVMARDAELWGRTQEILSLKAENAELIAQVQLAMPFVLADAKRTLNTCGCADATYREAEQLAKYARAALVKVKESA